MCHTIRNVFNKKLTYINLYEAHIRASKTKRNTKEVLVFDMDLETNLMNLYNKIKKGQYHLGKYRDFIIYEPKKRLIKSLPYVDRIVHQWYIEEFIKPYIIPRFIKDSYACIENRGTHLAVKNLQRYMRTMRQKYGEYYILKCDIKGFFYNIDKKILMNILQRYISDKKLLEFSKLLVFDGTGDVGIPIGNYTSQFFANIYLNELDHFIKDELKVKYMVRYMDDFVLLAENKIVAKELERKIEEFIDNKLHLTFNDKTNYYPNKKGVNFCGYRIFEDYILLRTSSKRKIKKNIKKWNKQYLNDEIDLNRVQLRWNSWVAHSLQCDSFNFRQKMYNRIIFKEYLKFPY